MVQLFKCLRTGARSIQAPNEKPVSGGDLFRLFPPADRCRCGAYLRQGGSSIRVCISVIFRALEQTRVRFSPSPSMLPEHPRQ